MNKKNKIKKYKVLLFVGGIGEERSVSLKSGKNILKALKKNDVFVVEIDSNKNWIFEKKIIKNKKKFLENFDIGINIIHGKYGEDGTLQKIFEKNNFPFLGTDSKVSKKTMEKNLTKKIFSEKEVLHAKSFIFTKKSNINYKNIFEKLGKKIIVKPTNSGSSFGISVAENISELKKSIKIAFSISEKIILEEFLEGEEFSCGVYFDGKKNKALPVVQIKYPGRIFFDYDAKYQGLSKEICPAKIDKKLTEKIQKKSLLVFNKIKCKDFSRIDFMVSKNKIYTIEINTLPGFTSESIFPKELKAAEINISDFFKTLIKSKIKK